MAETWEEKLLALRRFLRAELKREKARQRALLASGRVDETTYSAGGRVMDWQQWRREVVEEIRTLRGLVSGGPG